MARVFLSAGEVSGEQHAARLAVALRRARPDLALDCMGGSILAGAGCRLLFPLSDHAVLGIRAVLRQLGTFVDVLRRFAAYLDQQRPDVVVLVDYPGLHLRFAALARRRGIPVVTYICPQVWAWAPWRARRFARVVDRALVILPFEEAYWRGRGVAARFVGHLVADRLAEDEAARAPAPAGGGDAELERAAPVLALLPGSRPQEVAANLPMMLEVGKRLARRAPAARFFLPQLREDAAAACRRVLASTTGAPPVALRSEVAPVLRAARFALVASGTATFEVAWYGVPMVVVYGITPLEQALGRQLLTVPWISQANLVAGAPLVPEFVSAKPPIDEIAAACAARIDDGPTRDRTLEALRGPFREAFPPGAADRAAAEVLSFLPP